MTNKKPHILWTLFQVWKIWRLYPSLRLGQLVSNALCDVPEETLDHTLLNMRDETLVAYIRGERP